MKKEFKPTKKNLLMVEELILDIKSKKNKLVETKIGLQNSLGRQKEEYKEVIYKSKDFYEIKSKRLELKEAVTNVDIKIGKLNEELIFKNKLKNEIIFYLKENRTLEGGEDLEKVINKAEILIKKYKDFSKDRTRISSLRVMASEFVGELEDILKLKK